MVATRFLGDTECAVSPVMPVDLQQYRIGRRRDWHTSDTAVRAESKSRYAICAIAQAGICHMTSQQVLLHTMRSTIPESRSRFQGFWSPTWAMRLPERPSRMFPRQESCSMTTSGCGWQSWESVWEDQSWPMPAVFSRPTPSCGGTASSQPPSMTVARRRVRRAGRESPKRWSNSSSRSPARTRPGAPDESKGN